MPLLGFIIFWGFLIVGLLALSGLTATGITLLVLGAIQRSRDKIIGGGCFLVVTLIALYFLQDVLRSLRT